VEQGFFRLKIAVRDTAGMHEPHRKSNAGDDFRSVIWTAQMGPPLKKLASDPNLAHSFLPRWNEEHQWR
jgi:hypothetical protein